MYSKKWSKTLRQGDVVGRILYPKFKGSPHPVLRREGLATRATVSESLELRADMRYAVVVSHDCEFNDAKRPQFLIARVQEFQKDLPPDTRALVKAANGAVKEAEDEERYDYIDTFVLEPIPGCFETGQLVSFTTITALPMSMAAEIKTMKCAELKHEHRVQLRKKLGFFFGREADDVDDADKVAPPEPSPPQDQV